MAARPLNTQLLGEQIVNELRTQIIHGEIAQGSHLVETDIADQYEVSRGPVRDAFNRLVNEGLVVRKKRGCVVRGLSEKDVRDMYEVRAAFEEIAANHVVRDPDQTDWAGMEQCIAGMRQALEVGNSDTYAQQDLDFHDALIKNSHNKRVIDFWSTFMPTFSVMLQVTNAQDIDLNPSFHDQEEILKSLKSGKPADVKSLVDRHLNGSLNRMIRALKKLKR